MAHCGAQTAFVLLSQPADWSNKALLAQTHCNATTTLLVHVFIGTLMSIYLCVCRGYRVVAAAAGVNHSMALSSDGSLFTWGQ